MIEILKLNSAPKEVLGKILSRAKEDIDLVTSEVAKIIQDVRAEGDEALVRYTRRFDDSEYNLKNLVVTEEQFENAYKQTSPEVVEKIKAQVSFSKTFAKAQREKITDWEETISPGVRAGERWTPIDSVGLYVPGGKNPFPTVQQILAVSAKAAQCPRIASCISPRGNNYEVLIAAREAGINELYRVSGPQAIAALAYGTESIKSVELIAGPGNPYVTAAKMLSQKVIAIDMPAGPSEAIIYADDSLQNGLTLEKKARWCAADILARAEHGPDSAGVLVTTSEELALRTKEEVVNQFKTLSRKEYIQKALKGYSAIIVCDSEKDAIDFINEYAPEHLEILTEAPREALKKISNAGSVFLGDYNPVAVGDYASGVNHILPTGGWARRTSAVGVWTFMKRVQYSELTAEGLKALQPIVDTLADVEGLDAHRNSVDLRFS